MVHVADCAVHTTVRRLTPNDAYGACSTSWLDSVVVLLQPISSPGMRSRYVYGGIWMSMQMCIDRQQSGSHVVGMLHCLVLSTGSVSCGCRKRTRRRWWCGGEGRSTHKCMNHAVITTPKHMAPRNEITHMVHMVHMVRLGTYSHQHHETLYPWTQLDPYNFRIIPYNVSARMLSRPFG